jgi:hypothetical protein
MSQTEWQPKSGVSAKEHQMKYLGIVICLAIIIGVAFTVGINIFIDIMSLAFVFGGALGYALLKGNENDMTSSFGEGAIYFGWLGLLIGFIAIASNIFGALGGLENVGSALAVAMLPVLYGYVTRLICMVAASEAQAD